MAVSDFKEKKVWAVVGKVHDKERYPYKIYNFLKDKGYKVYAVDPTGQDVDGEKSYTSLKDLPEVPEAVDMVINPVKGEKYIDEANELGIKYIWFQPGAESAELVTKARENYGMNVEYMNCVMIEFK
jgi:predicted CoA-binding protein